MDKDVLNNVVIASEKGSKVLELIPAITERGQRAVRKSSAGNSRTIKAEEGFQLPDATAYEGDVGSFTVARVQSQPVSNVNAPSAL